MAKAGLLYVGTDDGVLVFSNPAGVGRWLPAGHSLKGYSIRALLAAPSNPLRLTAAASNEGLQRSDDGAQSWHKVLDLDVYAIVSHPEGPGTKYIAAEGGDIYRSENEGMIWEQCPQGEHPAGVPITALLVAPENPRLLYLALEGAGLWSSSDGGSTWEERSRGLPPHVTAVAASTITPGRLFANAGGTFYHSERGSGWEPVALPGGPPPTESALAVLPGKEEVLLATAGTTLLRSADTGASWQEVASEAPWQGNITVICPASYHIDTAFAGTDGGQIAISSDRGRTWQTIVQGRPAIRSMAAVRLA